MNATEPNGGTYTLRRRWWPWRWKQRISARPWDLTQGGANLGGDSISGFLIGIVALIALCFVLPIVFLLLVTGVEWLVLLVLVPFRRSDA